MKSIVIMCVVAMCGCANTSMLQAKVSGLEEQNKKLSDRVSELELGADTCTKMAAKTNELVNAASKKASEAYEASKEALATEVKNLGLRVSNEAKKAQAEAEAWIKDTTQQ